MERTPDLAAFEIPVAVAVLIVAHLEHMQVKQ